MKERSPSVTVVASGGGVPPEHILAVLDTGRTDAALAAGIFHFGENSVEQMRKFLAGFGVPVRVHLNGRLRKAVKLLDDA